MSFVVDGRGHIFSLFFNGSQITLKLYMKSVSCDNNGGREGEKLLFFLIEILQYNALHSQLIGRIVRIVLIFKIYCC